MASFCSGSDDADLVTGLPLLCLAPTDCLLTHPVQHLQHICSNFLVPGCNPRVIAKIKHAFAALKDKKINRSLERFSQSCKFAYNRAYFESAVPRNRAFIVGDAWQNALLYGYWQDLREHVGVRIGKLMDELSARPKLGFSDQGGSFDCHSWGLESRGYIPACEI